MKQKRSLLQAVYKTNKPNDFKVMHKRGIILEKNVIYFFGGIFTTAPLLSIVYNLSMSGDREVFTMCCRSVLLHKEIQYMQLIEALNKQ